MHAPTYLHRIGPDDVIESVNDAWIRFAEENGAPTLPQQVLGTSLWRHVAGPAIVHLWMQLVAGVRGSGREVAVPFRCDSPSLRRFMRMRVLPLAHGRVEFCTWVEREEPFREPLLLPDSGAPKDPARLVRQCAWCKKIEAEGRWLEIEQAIENQRWFDRPLVPAITHGVCDGCLKRMLTSLPPG